MRVRYLGGMKIVPMINPVVWPHAGLSALLVVAIQLVAYVLGVDAMVSPWSSLAVSLAFPIGMSLALIALRRDEGNVLSFGRGWRHAWAVAAVMQAAQTGYQLILFHVLAPDIIEPVISATLDALDERLGAFGDAMGEATAFKQEIEVSLRDGFTVRGLLYSGLWGWGFSAVGALVVALVFRRKPASEFE